MNTSWLKVASLASFAFTAVTACSAGDINGTDDQGDTYADDSELMSLGTDLAKKQNPKFLSQSLQYGAHAIELIEADKKPANMDDAAWKQYKTTVLPSVYQSMGLLNLVKGDQAAAKAQFVKASELAPSDAFNFLMLAGMLNDEYQNEAKHYQSLPAGPAKTDELKKAQAMLYAVIDAYAHAIALA